MKIKTLLAGSLVMAVMMVPLRAEGQMNAEGVEAAVHTLFDAMRTADGPTAEALFHSQARLHSVVMAPDGGTSLASSPIAAFVQAVGTPRDELWDERIWDRQIHVDGGLGTAWMNYAFYRDDQLSHCGVNAFQFVYLEGSWKILQITDTRYMQGCDPPV